MRNELMELDLSTDPFKALGIPEFSFEKERDKNNQRFQN